MANGTERWCMAEYDVTGYDKDGRKVFHLIVEAVNSDVAQLYATARLQRTPDGAEAVRNAIKTKAIRKLTERGLKARSK